MQKVKGSFLAVLALAMLAATGCDRHSNKEVYYLISANLSLPYWQTAQEGFNQAAAEYKVTARVDGPSNDDPGAELGAMQKAIAAKPAGILISVADSAVLTPAINAAIAAGIPVITMDSDAADSKRLYFIGTNNLQAGRMDGRRVAEKLNGKGNVVFFTVAGQSNTEERLKGFKDAFASYPDIKIVDVIDVKEDARTAFDKAQQLVTLTGAKKIAAFISLDSASGKPLADAVKRFSTGGQFVMAWDVNPDVLNAIKSGEIDATISQKPYTMGYAGLRALDDIFHAPPAKLDKDYSADSFSPFPVFVDTGTDMVDKTNVDAYLAAAAQRAK